MFFNLMRLGLAVYVVTMAFAVVSSLSVFQTMWEETINQHESAQAMVAQAGHQLLIYDTADSAASAFNAVEPAAGR